MDMLLPEIDPATGKLDPAVIPAGSSGSGAGQVAVMEWAWYFPGDLVVRTGLARRRAPASGFGPLGTRARLVQLSANLGTIPSYVAGTKVTGRLARNNGTLKTFEIPAGSEAVEVDLSDVANSVAYGDYLTIDITGVPAGTTIKAGDLTVQLWWKWG